MATSSIDADPILNLIVSDVIRRNELHVWFVAERVVEVSSTHAV